MYIPRSCPLYRVIVCFTTVTVGLKAYHRRLLCSHFSLVCWSLATSIFHKRVTSAVTIGGASGVMPDVMSYLPSKAKSGLISTVVLLMSQVSSDATLCSTLLRLVFLRVIKFCRDRTSLSIVLSTVWFNCCNLVCILFSKTTFKSNS